MEITKENLPELIDGYCSNCNTPIKLEYFHFNSINGQKLQSLGVDNGNICGLCGKKYCVDCLNFLYAFDGDEQLPICDNCYPKNITNIQRYIKKRDNYEKAVEDCCKAYNKIKNKMKYLKD